MLQSPSAADDRRAKTCRFELRRVRSVDRPSGPAIRVSAVFEPDDTGRSVLLLVKRPAKSLAVHEPAQQGDRGDGWWAEFPLAAPQSDEPAPKLALLLPDGRRIELPEPAAGRWARRRIAAAVAVAALMTAAGWVALDRARVAPEHDSPSPSSDARDAPASRLPARETLTPVQAVARTPKGMSLVVHAVARSVALYPSARATQARRFLRNRNAMRVPTVFLVKSAAGNRFQVALPIRPNGSTAWVRAVDVRPTLVRHRMNVDLTRRRLSLWRGTELIARVPIGVGRAVTPTPTGTYYVTALLKQPDPRGLYGPYAFALSGHSPVLNEFAGGNGRIGIHGTNEPWAIGTDVSHGCIRVANVFVRRLARLLALGTPVRIWRS